jgi:uncharacterized cupredoxin-like copper-binding protein
MSNASRQRLARQRARRLQLMGAGAVVAVLAVVLVTAVLASRGSSGPKTEVAISMTDYAFTPNPIEVTAGDVRFTVANDGLVSHDFVLPQLGKGTADQQPGNTSKLDVNGLRPGTYLVVCDLPGHRALGMETQLIVR